MLAENVGNFSLMDVYRRVENLLLELAEEREGGLIVVQGSDLRVGMSPWQSGGSPFIAICHDAGSVNIYLLLVPDSMDIRRPLA